MNKKPGNPMVPRPLLVEAAGQLFHGFRHGLDYAFILFPGCRASYSPMHFRRILVFAHRAPPVSEPMSLYRAGLRLALYLPLGVAMPPCGGAGFADVSPVFISPLRASATN